jgi:hypothetical protein
MMFECIDKFYPSVSIETLTGSIVSFNDEYGGLPLKSCTSLISGYQEGSGIPSPQNVRPLHAWSGANITACGVNLWDEEWEVGTYNSAGQKASATKSIRNVNHILVKPNTVYTIVIPSQVTNSRRVWRDINGDFILYENNNRLEITSPDNACYLDISFTDYGTEYNNDCSVNYPSTDTEHHAYNGNTYTFTFGQDIYQGYIDWKRGVVTAKWGYIASYNGETLTGEWLCNKAPYEVGTTPPTGSQVAYELATPIEIPLGGINLLTQEGQNNIFCNTGDTTVEYIKIN